MREFDDFRSGAARRLMLTTFHPLGMALDVETSEPEALAAARAAFAGWEGGVRGGARRLRLDLRVRDALRGAGPADIWVAGHQLRLSGNGIRCRANARTGRGLCAFSRDYLADGALLQAGILDTVALFLLARNGRTPVHAAGILAGDLAILLAGPSGAGKSCLARAALEAGLSIISDDTVYIEGEPDFRVWGLPRPIHLFPSDAPRGIDAALRARNGKLKRAVPIGDAAHVPTARRATLCLLARGGDVALAHIDAGEAMRGFATLEAGFDLLADDIHAAVAGLVRLGGWRLTLSANPADAIALLLANLSRLGGAAR